MDSINNDTYAYLAGLIDADGSITIINRNYVNKKSKGYRIQVWVYNCKTLIINHILNLLGGDARSNNINKTHKKWRNCIRYTIQDTQAANLISNILPFLIIKKNQALIALKANIIQKKYNNPYKRWHPELKIECDKELAELKIQINKLNIRGTEKQFETINVKNIPFNIHYLAGFCDADGSILITKMGKQLCAKIIFTNTNKNVIDWIKLNLGGNLYIKKQKIINGILYII